MALVFRYSDPKGVDEPAETVDLGNEVVRLGTVTLVQSADQGQTSTSSLVLDDPDGSLAINGYRALTILETEAPAGNQVVWRGAIGARTYRRAPDKGFLTGSAREIEMELLDHNWNLDKRVLIHADAKRPDESASDRLHWLVNDADHFGPQDYGNVTYPTGDVEDNDYRGQTAKTLLDDCLAEKGYMYWAAYNETQNHVELFVIDPNDQTTYDSGCRITNDPDDVDNATTFGVFQDAALVRSPERLAFGVFLAYKKGSVYVRNEVVGEQYAKVDRAAPMANVKRQARAEKIAQRFLNQNDEEDDRVTCTVLVPASKVNSIRAGHLVQAKFSHFPGWQSYVYARVMERRVNQVADELISGDTGEYYYQIDLDLSPIGGGAPGFLGSQWEQIEGSPWLGPIDFAPVASGATLIVFSAFRQLYWDISGTPPVLRRNGASGTTFTLLEDYPGDTSACGSGGASSCNGICAHTLTTDGTETDIYWETAHTSSHAVVVAVAGTPTITSSVADHITASKTATGPSVTPTPGSSAIILGWFTQGNDFPNATRILGAGDGWTVLYSETNEDPERWKPHPVLVYKAVDSASGSYAPKATSDQANTWDCITVAVSF